MPDVGRQLEVPFKVGMSRIPANKMAAACAMPRIKPDPAPRSIPIRAVGEEKKARAAGCDDYVPKPYSPRKLREKIRQYPS
jgi:CheY-like chemotaxis protein